MSEPKHHENWQGITRDSHTSLTYEECLQFPGVVPEQEAEMSKKKGPFDEAIQAIRFYIAEEPELDRDRKNRAKVKLQRLDKFDAAIRVLEAVGKMKDPRATKLAFLTIIDEARIDEENQFVCDIRGLLEALPSEREK